MNVVAFALDLLEERGPVKTFEELEQLVGEMLSMFNTWDKYRRSGGLKSCPNLAASGVVKVEQAPEVPSMEDIFTTITPDDQPLLVNLFVEESGGGEAEDSLEGGEAVGSVQESQGDQYREYMKGKES